jgi:pimeloyl-ACP methyl ester carboxylesterase
MIRRACLLGLAAVWLAVAGRAGVRAASTVSVTLKTEDGVNLAGTLYQPSGRNAPAVILLHMLTRSHEDWHPFALRLADAGIAALAIDLRGQGASAPGPGSGGEDLSRMLLDVKAARAFLAARSDLAGAVGIAGASIGANLAILHAASDPTVRSIALLSAGLDYRGLRVDNAMRKYGDRPALLLASQEDPYAARSARELATLGTGVRELRLLNGAGHGTVMLARQPEVAVVLLDWFRRTLL